MPAEGEGAGEKELLGFKIFIWAASFSGYLAPGNSFLNWDCPCGPGELGGAGGVGRPEVLPTSHNYVRGGFSLEPLCPSSVLRGPLLANMLTPHSWDSNHSPGGWVRSVPVLLARAVSFCSPLAPLWPGCVRPWGMSVFHSHCPRGPSEQDRAVLVGVWARDPGPVGGHRSTC